MRIGESLESDRKNALREQKELARDTLGKVLADRKNRKIELGRTIEDDEGRVAICKAKKVSIEWRSAVQARHWSAARGGRARRLQSSTASSCSDSRERGQLGEGVYRSNASSCNEAWLARARITYNSNRWSRILTRWGMTKTPR